MLPVRERAKQMQEIDRYFLDQQEPLKGYLLYLRSYILNFETGISESWNYGMPFFYYKRKRFSYLWVQKKTGWPYIGFVDGIRLSHPELLLEKRSRMKILLLDPLKDVPLKKIDALLNMALDLYR